VRNRLSRASLELDTCCDLLRQRRALGQAGENPDEARERDATTVEEYEQQPWHVTVPIVRELTGGGH
jgi:hypothetical protein